MVSHLKKKRKKKNQKNQKNGERKKEKGNKLELIPFMNDCVALFLSVSLVFDFHVLFITEIDNYDNKLQAVIAAPSKQLAHQIKNLADHLCAGGSKGRLQNPIRIELLTSDGLDPYTRNRLGDIDREEGKWPHLLIGTPGVLAEYLVDQDYAPPLNLRHLVLEEIDYLLNLPHYRGSIRIMLSLRQRCTADATHPQNIGQVEGSNSWSSASLDDNLNEAEQGMINEWDKPISTKVVCVTATATDTVFRFAKAELTPGYVLCTPDKALLSTSQNKFRNAIASLPRRIHHYYVSCHSRVETLPLLCEHLRKLWLEAYKVAPADRKPLHPKVAVFFNKWDQPLVRQLQYVLKKKDFKVGLLSEWASRHECREAMSEKIQVLLTTDLYSRGLDFSSLSHVVNYHVPQRANAYTHRAGRVGR